VKKLFHPATITLIVVTIIFLLPLILPNKAVVRLNDSQLREVALSTGMLPIPTSYEKLLEVVDNPLNPMTPTKIALGKELFNEKLLSRDRDMSCASCHLLDKGGDDNLPTAIGHRDRA